VSHSDKDIWGVFPKGSMVTHTKHPELGILEVVDAEWMGAEWMGFTVYSLKTARGTSVSAGPGYLRLAVLDSLAAL
jgi:hypothetical protein